MSKVGMKHNENEVMNKTHGESVPLWRGEFRGREKHALHYINLEGRQIHALY